MTRERGVDGSVLDDPVGNALRGAQSAFALAHASAIRYRPDVSPFCSVGSHPMAETWDSLGDLLGPTAGALFNDPGFAVPDDWRALRRFTIAQLVDTVDDRPSPPTSEQPRPLTTADVPQMIRLTSATQPGPFAERTIELGGYVGIFDAGLLVAMAGRRMNPAGFVEVSAVCTDPAYRGRGYARAVMLEVMRGIRSEGSVPFLHVADGNPARALYEQMGFRERRLFEAIVIERVA